MIVKTKYGEYQVELDWDTITKVMKLIDSEDRSPVMVVTTNVPGTPLKEDEILVKNWSENEGILEELQRLGVVGEVLAEIPTGYVVAHKVRVLI